MKYINVETGAYPVSLREIRAQFPNTSFRYESPPAPFAVIVETDRPPAQPGHRVVAGEPRKVNGYWETTWVQKPFTEAELRQTFKENRALAVERIRVTTSLGNTFDGDETSQNRMARTAIAMRPGEMIPWMLSDNVPRMVSREELSEALRLAGEAQSALWMPSTSSGTSEQ